MNIPLEIDCAAVKNKLGKDANFFLVDCREPDEYATAHIEGAMLLPMSELGERLHELSPHQTKQLVIHCHHGGRSLRVAKWLRENGYPTAQSMAGGIDDWSQNIDTSVPRY
jgi:rhodanese-related sulfurtransferase